MTNETITREVEAKKNSDKLLNIHFKQRNMITGLFIKTNDYENLKSKNLWRIVNKARVEEWKKTKDIDLCRIFNGSEFTRLSEAN